MNGEEIFKINNDFTIGNTKSEDNLEIFKEVNKTKICEEEFSIEEMAERLNDINCKIDTNNEFLEKELVSFECNLKSNFQFDLIDEDYSEDISLEKLNKITEETIVK